MRLLLPYTTELTRSELTQSELTQSELARSELALYQRICYSATRLYNSCSVISMLMVQPAFCFFRLGQ